MNHLLICSSSLLGWAGWASGKRQDTLRFRASHARESSADTTVLVPVECLETFMVQLCQSERVMRCSGMSVGLLTFVLH